MSHQRLRFGILGTGDIANQFAQGIAGAKRSEISAVGSRSTGWAKAFAQRFNVGTAHGSYGAFQAGKHVLCERPTMPAEASLSVMCVLDEMRRQVGLSY